MGGVYMSVLILLNEPTMGLWQPQSPRALYSPGRRKYWRPPVVRVLIKDPATLHDGAGVNVTEAETLMHVGAVFHEFHHVSHHVRPVVDLQLVGSSILDVKEIRT